MNKKFVNTFLTAALVTTCASAFADWEIGETESRSAWAASAFNQACGTVAVKASYIYWLAEQDSMDVAYVDPSVVLGYSSGKAVAYHKRRYQPGLKLALGINTRCDEWAVWVKYTRLYQKTRDIHTAPTATLSAPQPPSGQQVWSAPDWFINKYTTMNTLSKIHSQWTMNLDMWDLLFSRLAFQSCSLTVYPYAGLTVLGIHQAMRIRFPKSATVLIGSKSKNTSQGWGVGPKLGVEANWLLGAGFRIEGYAAGNILYTNYSKIAHKEKGQLATTPKLNLGTVGGSVHNFTVLRPVSEMGIGIGWIPCLNEYNLNIDISLRYDLVYLWEQNVMRKVVSEMQGRVDHVGDLQLHGLTLSGAIIF